MMAGRYAHAKQFKRHRRQLRLLRTRLGRLIRDIRRKITGRPELEAAFEQPLWRAAQIRSQEQRQRGWKLYFLPRARGRMHRQGHRRRPQPPPHPHLAEASVAPNLDGATAPARHPDRAQLGFLTDD
jgi:hypothetical protein